MQQKDSISPGGRMRPFRDASRADKGCENRRRLKWRVASGRKRTSMPTPS